MTLQQAKKHLPVVIVALMGSLLSAAVYYMLSKIGY